MTTMTIGRSPGQPAYDTSFTIRPLPGYPKINGRNVQIEANLLMAITGGVLNDPYDDFVKQQLLGLVDNEDEEVVPCTWTADPTFDGFYRPIGVSITPQGPTRWRVALSLERLKNYACPVFEVNVQSVLRTNAHSIVSSTHILLTAFVNAGFGSLSIPAGYPTLTTLPAVNLPGGISLQLDRRTSTTPLNAGNQYAFAQTPAEYYSGSCQINMIGAGGITCVAIGRTIPQLQQGDWSISNGLVRFTLGAAYTNDTLLQVFNSSGTPESILMKHYDSANTGIGFCNSTFAGNVEILRNSPECVSVRHSGSLYQETFTLNRGARHVVWTVKRTDGVNIPNTWGAKRATAAAATAITAGLRATSNDGNGNRIVIASPHGITNDLANCTIRLTTAQAAPVTFMLAGELEGSAAVSGDFASELVGQFMSAVSWRQRVVTP